MKKIVLVLGLLLIGFWFCGCATTITIVKSGTAPEDEAYKFVLIQNKTPFWVTFPIGTGNVILGPGTEIVTKKIRPLDWLSPSFGWFSFIAYAYRKFDGKTLDEFVGQREFWIYLDGYPRVYDGRVFGDVVIMRYFPVSSFGHPDRWKGNLWIIPYEVEFEHY